MSTYPYGTPSTGVFEIFQTNFSPDDMVKGIRDNYSPVNRTTLMNSVGYQLGLIQNFVNAGYLGRSVVPVSSGYITNIVGKNIDISGYISISGRYPSAYQMGAYVYESCDINKSGMANWFYDDGGYVYQSYNRANYIQMKYWDSTGSFRDEEINNISTLKADYLRVLESGFETGINYLTYGATSITGSSTNSFSINSSRDININAQNINISGSSYVFVKGGGILPRETTNYLGSAPFKWWFVYGRTINGEKFVSEPNLVSISNGATNPASLLVEKSIYRFENNNDVDYTINMTIGSIGDGQIVNMYCKPGSNTGGVILTGVFPGAKSYSLRPGEGLAMVCDNIYLYPLLPSGVYNA